LRRLASALADHLDAYPDTSLAGVAAALATGRGKFAHRAACLARDRGQALAGLRSIAEGEQPTTGAIGLAGSERPKVAFLFSGQGSQWPGMAADLHAADPMFRDRVEAAARRLGTDFATLMFDPAAGERLTDTAQAQPALFVLEYALAEMLASFGIEPDIVAGHSLGEWSAACVAGMLPFEVALDVVAARGRLMGALPREGEMVAVFAPLERVAPLLARFGACLDIAALNAPDEVVVSGDKDAIASLLADLDVAAIGCQGLPGNEVLSAYMEEMRASGADPVRNWDEE
jgi:acyl transferase domain-containing protein